MISPLYLSFYKSSTLEWTVSDVNAEIPRLFRRNYDEEPQRWAEAYANCVVKELIKDGLKAIVKPVKHYAHSTTKLMKLHSL